MAKSTRPPIVAVMGHIDHGKSSLLDYIRNTNIVQGEAGGITQHVSAYETTHTYEGVERTITFLDTPGHESFKALRARGARAADIGILIVAADEGVKPQTLEAYNSIIESELPFVVAFTKMDKPNADLTRAQGSVLEAGIYLEGLGGSIPYAAISNKTGEGISDLLDLVLLTADLNEFSADPTLPAEGFVLESSQDPRQGARATLIIKNGSLSTGDFVVSEGSYAPVRFIENYAHKRVSVGLPSQPVVISGWTSIPSAGALFTTVKTKKEAEKQVSDVKKSTQVSAVGNSDARYTLPLIVKADVSGSLDGIEHELAKITHENAVVRIVTKGIGSVTENDVKTAVSTGGIVIAFHSGIDASARDLADRSNVRVEQFSIIYELAQRVEQLLKEMSPKLKREEVLAKVKVLKVFSTSGKKHVIGARLEEGALELNQTLKIDRRGVDLGFGKLTNLQIARADVKELKVLGEFGAQVESKEDIAGGDTLTAFRIIEV